MKRTIILMLAVALLTLVAPNAFAANFLAESCEALGDPAVLPFQESLTPTSDDFNLAGCLADTSGLNDFVVCYTPANDCQVSLQVGYPQQGIEANIAVGVASGSCDPAPQQCQSQTGDGVVGGGLSLEAGVEVCFIVEAAVPAEQVTLIIDGDGCEDAEDTPVELESFSVSR